MIAVMTDTVQIRIIEAAGPIFAQKGFAATTVREICSAAKVNQAAINYYFGNKEKLYKEVFASTYSSFTSIDFIDTDLDSSRPFEERFRRMIVRRTQEILATELSRWKVQLIFRELHDPTSSCGEKLQEFIIQDYNALYHYLEEYFAPETPEPIRWQCIFCLFGTIFFYKNGGWVVRKIVDDEMRTKFFRPEQIGNFAVNAFFTAAAPYKNK
jgi:AcrR family transcriptional regulator